MSESLQAAFVVDRIPRQVWDALELPARGESATCAGLPGQFVVRDRDPERLVTFGDPDGGELALRFEPVTAAGWPTRVSVTASAHWGAAAQWHEHIANLQLFLTSGVVCPTGPRQTAGRFTLREVGFGVEVVDLAEASVLARCGLEGGDVVLIVNAVRVLSADAVRAVIAAARGRVSLAWVRAGTLMRGEVGPGPPDTHLRSPD